MFVSKCLHAQLYAVMHTVIRTRLRICTVVLGYKICRLLFCKMVRPTLDKRPGHDTRLNLIVKLQFLSCREYEILLHCHDSQIHSDPE